MGFLDGMIVGNFKTMDDGTEIYFPDGTRGKGYVLLDEEKKQDIRKKMKLFFAIVFFPAMMLITILFDFALVNRIPRLPVFIITILFIVITRLFTSYLKNGWIEGLPESAEKLTTKEMYKNYAKSNSAFFLWVYLFISFFLVLGGVLMLWIFITYLNPDLFRSEGYFITFIFCLFIIGIPFGCYLTFISGYMIRVKRGK